MKKGFTLIELLVVMMIIAVLAAFALPMYQHAVDQSRWGGMLSSARALKEAQERIFMTTSHYSDTVASLDIELAGTQNDNSIVTTDVTYTLENNYDDPLSYAIGGTHSAMPDNKLMMYLDKSPNFAGNIHCEAKTSNARAMHLCSALTDNVVGTRGEYTIYLVEGNSTGILTSWTAAASCEKGTAYADCQRYVNQYGEYYETYTNPNNGMYYEQYYDANGNHTHSKATGADKVVEAWFENNKLKKQVATYSDKVVTSEYTDGVVSKQIQEYEDRTVVFNVNNGKPTDVSVYSNGALAASGTYDSNGKVSTYSWFENGNLKQYSSYDDGNPSSTVVYWTANPGTVQYYNDYNENGEVTQTKYWPDGSVRGYYNADHTIATEYREDGSCSRSEVYGTDGRATTMYLYNTDGTYVVKPALYSESSDEGTPDPDESHWTYGTYTTGTNGDVIRDDGVTIPGSGNFASLCTSHPEQPQCAG